jgi:CRP-like cAMP-binding protein
MSDHFWYLKRSDLFERLAPDDIARLESRSRIRKCEKHQLIYLPNDQNDAVLLLAQGRVKLYHLTGDGKQAVLALIEPGEFFGELALFDTGRREEFAETMENSTVILIPRGEIEALMERHPAFSVSVTKLIGLRRRTVERRLKSLLFRSNRERLIHLLLELAEKYGCRTATGILLRIKLSHQEMSGLIGSTRETVTLLLGELQQERLISVVRRQIFVTDLDRLAASVSMRPPVLPACPRLAGELLPQTEPGS